MFGRYYDNRAHPRFVHILTAVPYLDTEIFNMQTNALRESRKARDRTSRAVSAIQRTKLKSEELSNGLRDSRLKRDAEGRQFAEKMQETHKQTLDKQKTSWKDYTAERTKDRRDYLQDQAYLDNLLTTNTEKAASRLTTVRRWQ